jgi:hypothetical protein
MALATPPFASRGTANTPPPITVGPEYSLVVRMVSVPEFVFIRPVEPMILPTPVKV